MAKAGRRDLSIETRVAARIRALRERLGLSQADLARLAHTSRSQVNSVERGDRAPTVATVEQFARALRVQPSDILDEGAAEPNPPSRADRLATRLRGRPEEFLDVVEAVVGALERHADRPRRRQRPDRGRSS